MVNYKVYLKSNDINIKSFCLFICSYFWWFIYNYLLWFVCFSFFISVKLSHLFHFAPFQIQEKKTLFLFNTLHLEFGIWALDILILINVLNASYLLENLCSHRNDFAFLALNSNIMRITELWSFSNDHKRNLVLSLKVLLSEKNESRKNW